MPIQDSDLLLIEDTSGVSKKIEASKLKANLAANTYNNHKLLVNKPDYTSRFVYAQNMQQSVGLTDYMMVERSGVSYKVTGQQIIDYFPSVPAGAAGAIVDVTYGGSVSNITPTPSLDVFSNPPDFSASYTSALQLATVRTTFTFDAPWDMSKVAYTRGGSHGAGQQITFTFWDTNGRQQSAPFITAAGYNGSHNLGSIDFSVPIVKIEIYVDGVTGYFWGFYDAESPTGGVAYPASIESTTLTLASDDNLDLFTPGDAIAMVDSNGDEASYIPVTSTITSVSQGRQGLNVTQDGAYSGSSWDSVFGDEVRTDGFSANLSNSVYCYQATSILTLAVAKSGDFDFLCCSGDGTTADGKVTINLKNSSGTVVSSFTGPYAPQPVTRTETISGTDVKTIEIVPASPGIQISAININGKQLNNSSEVELAFESPNPDLKFFLPGSIATASDGVTFVSFFTSLGNLADYTDPNLSPGADDPYALFDGNLEIFGGRVELGRPGDFLRVEFSPPVQVNSSLKFYGGSVAAGANNCRITINDNDEGLFDTNPSYVLPCYDGSFTGLLKSFQWTSDVLGVGGTGFEIDGVIYTNVATPENTGVVISTDIAANTMIVNQGKFTGTDGSTSAIGYEYVCHNLSTTGTATFTSPNGNPCSHVVFASYGTPTACPDPEISSCHQDVIPTAEGYLVGTTSIELSQNLFLIGDPCVGTVKRVIIKAAYPKPNPSAGLTVATSLAKSGTGRFNSNTGVDVDVTGSNKEWIDNTNRLGENFYIKAASTRTGLAILRTKAIKVGTEIAQAVSDIKDGEFAIVDNNYWFKDEDTLIDLGPVNLPSK